MLQQPALLASLMAQRFSLFQLWTFFAAHSKLVILEVASDELKVSKKKKKRVCFIPANATIRGYLKCYYFFLLA